MSFANREYTIPAYGSVTFNVKASAFNVLHADLPVQVGFDDGSETERVEQGLGIPVNGGFEKIRFENGNPTDVFIRVAFNDQAIIDNRLTASSDLKVVDPGGGGESFADVIAKQTEILAMMQNANDQRRAIASYGQSYVGYSSANGVATVVAPAANTHGLILRTVDIANASIGLSLFADTSAPSSDLDTAKRLIFRIHSSTRIAIDGALPMYIAPGDGLYIVTDASARVFLTWDNLA